MTSFTDAILAEEPTTPNHPDAARLAALILDLDDVGGWSWGRAEPVTPSPDAQLATRYLMEAWRVDDGVAHAALLLAADIRFESR